MQHRMKDIQQHRMALKHMMGQLHDMGRDSFSSSELARLMGVSLPTAIDRLNRMQYSKHVHKEIKPHRPNAKAYKWSLTTEAKRLYRNGHFETYYELWRDEVFGVKKND